MTVRFKSGRSQTYAARRRYMEGKASSARDIADAEVKGTPQSRKMSRFSGRVRSSRS